MLVPMRLLSQEAMNRLFDVTDDLELDREQVVVPLAMEGEGSVRRLSNGKIEIVLPDADDLGPFLSRLPGLLDVL